jgi:hypothetical protein
MGAHQSASLEFIFFLNFTGVEYFSYILKLYSGKLESPHGANICFIE